ncbi:MAG: hypothetical protein M3521_12945 [Acidobacteriota bacterium]|jgi:hypothetical protein|nr:hypothetical protein [Acidobacteriota bacterium]
MDIELPEDFKDFLKLLNKRAVRYLLVGGYAVGFHGYPRATNDIDFWIELNRENAEKIVEVIREFGFNPPELSPELFLKDKQVIRMGFAPLRIEVLTEISGVNFAECFAERTVAEFDGIKVNILGLKHLKINKKASGRLKDLADLENLP